MYVSTAFLSGRYAVMFTTVWASPHNAATACGVSKQAWPVGRPVRPCQWKKEERKKKKYIGHSHTDQYLVIPTIPACKHILRRLASYFYVVEYSVWNIISLFSVCLTVCQSVCPHICLRTALTLVLCDVVVNCNIARWLTATDDGYCYGDPNWLEDTANYDIGWSQLDLDEGRFNYNDTSYAWSYLSDESQYRWVSLVDLHLLLFAITGNYKKWNNFVSDILSHWSHLPWTCVLY